MHKSGSDWSGRQSRGVLLELLSLFLLGLHVVRMGIFGFLGVFFLIGSVAELTFWLLAVCLLRRHACWQAILVAPHEATMQFAAHHWKWVSAELKKVTEEKILPGREARDRAFDRLLNTVRKISASSHLVVLAVARPPWAEGIAALLCLRGLQSSLTTLRSPYLFITNEFLEFSHKPRLLRLPPPPAFLASFRVFSPPSPSLLLRRSHRYQNDPCIHGARLPQRCSSDNRKRVKGTSGCLSPANWCWPNQPRTALATFWYHSISI